jgi:tocopherol O-methyltransferase
VWLAAPCAPAWTQRFLLEPICYEGQLSGLPTAEAYRQWLRAAGFTDLHCEDVSTKVQRTWTVVIRRVVSALVRRSDYRHYLLNHAQRNRRFALTLIRLWLAFRVGAFRYGILSAQKPS